MIRRRDVIIIIALGAVIIVLLGVLWFVPSKKPTLPPDASGVPMVITSPAFQNGEAIPRKFTCDGGDVNPEFFIQNVPAGAKSLALIMDDPDAPRGTFTHWVVLNIDPAITVIKEESAPPGSLEVTNSFGKSGYGGPCPGSGTHRYIFKLYALKSGPVNFVKEPTMAEARAYAEGDMIAKAELMGTYLRQR